MSPLGDDNRHTSARFALTFPAPAVRDAYDMAAHRFVDTVESLELGADGWDAPGMGVWSLRSLVGHTARALATVPAYLASGADKAVMLTHPFEYFAVLTSVAAAPDAVAERGRQAGIDLGDDPLGHVRRLRDEALGAVAASPDDAPVDTPAGVMHLVDYLVSRIFELTIHTGDVARAASVEFAPARGPATITLASLGALADARGTANDAIAALAGRLPLPDGYSTL